jgi:putative transposase
MPRRLRIHVPGGFYHVTLRGNHRQAIFRTAADRSLLDAIVARSLVTHVARLHAYCWMTNHLHFFVQVGETPLGMLMRDIASNYARAYQAKLETTGHLFERRYYAKLVDIDAYLFAVLRYIHLNPVSDGLVAAPGDYPWSSHRAYAGEAAPPGWLESDFVLSMVAPVRAQAQAAYRRFIGEPPSERDNVDTSGDGDILGTDAFTARVLNAPANTRRAVKPLEQFICDACRIFDIPDEVLKSVSRDQAVVQARAWIAYHAMKEGAATLSQVARALGRDRATLRYAMRQHSRTLETPK